MADKDKSVPSRETAQGGDVDAFLRRIAETPVRKGAGSRGRLIFAMDATASRQPTWDRAAQLQAEMFRETAALGGLEIQVVFYRGYREFKVSPWMTDADRLLRLMTSVTCLAGETQLRKVLVHAANETKQRPVNALVFVGDCMEEDIDRLGEPAGELGLLGVPAFMFQEGHDDVAAYAFQQVAKLSGGAFCHFDASSPQTLRDLLNAVAVFAAGGRKALADMARQRGGGVRLLANQMGRAGGKSGD